MSSPHTRGCFCPCTLVNAGAGVFPAYAGVFLSVVTFPADKAGLPRIRGGVSEIMAGLDKIGESSPHTRGCFFRAHHREHQRRVFPAYAGVFPP